MNIPIWTEHRNPEGRTYWFNTGTRESVWEKPDDLKSPFERALNQTKWKEYFSGGRKYYYNTETKESKWDMPDELLLVLEKVEKEGQTSAVAAPARAITAPGFTPVGNVLSPTDGNPASSIHQNGNDLQVGAHTGGLPVAPSSILPSRPNIPEDPVIPHNGFLTFEEGEKAFMHLLRKSGVDPTWTWDQTMRAIITDPLYKSLNNLSDKKAAYEKYTSALKAKDQEEKELRLSKLRPAIRNMLKGNPNVFHYSTFATADKLFSQHPIWQQAKIESERKLIFEEYVAELKQREMNESRAAQSRSLTKLVKLFSDLEVDVLTRWRTAHNLILDSEEWNSDPELRKLATLDILLAFEDYSRVQEREYDDQTRRAQVEKTRRERKAREAFKELLEELVTAGKIKSRTKWKDVYPLFRNDERYLSMLGNPGSNQLELFWDVVDALDQKSEAKIALVQDAIKRYNAKNRSTEDGPDVKMEPSEEKEFVVDAETTEEEFKSVLKLCADPAVDALGEEELRGVFDAMHEIAVKKQADEKRRAERKQRHLQDDLRYALKKLPEPLDISLSYEDAVPLIENLPEYIALEDEGRRAAFSKFVKRQKERLREAAASEDGGSATSRKRKEPTRDHRDEPDREKERDRGEKERDREPHKERERERDRGKEYEKDGRTRYRHDDHDSHGYRSSRDFGKDKERDRDDKDRERDRDRDYRSSKHGHYRDEKDDRRREKDRGKEKERKSEYGYGGRDWDEPPSSSAKQGRDRSLSGFKDEPREKREISEDGMADDRAEKRPRYDAPAEPIKTEEQATALTAPPVRAETPEEGEI